MTKALVMYKLCLQGHFIFGTRFRSFWPQHFFSTFWLEISEIFRPTLPFQLHAKNQNGVSKKSTSMSWLFTNAARMARTRTFWRCLMFVLHFGHLGFYVKMPGSNGTIIWKCLTSKRYTLDSACYGYMVNTITILDIWWNFKQLKQTMFWQNGKRSPYWI